LKFNIKNIMLKIISQQYEWSCGDGCCSESKYMLYFLIQDSDDGHWSKFWVEDCYTHSPNIFQEVLLLHKEDTFIGSLLRQASMANQIIFEVTDEEYVGY